jgi:RHS repeat-associated protein
MTTIQDARQITYLTNVYDPTTGALIRQIQADGGTYLFNWTVTGATTNNSFSVVEGVGAPPPYSVMTFRYCSGCSEGYPTLVSQVDVTDPNQNVRRVVFNSYGYATSDTRALGKPEQQTTAFAYYDDNLPKSVTDQLGRVTSFDHDVNANTTTVTRLSGTSNAVTTALTYDGTYAQPMTATDFLGHTTTMMYDTAGNLTTVADPLGHSTTFTHTGSGLLASVTDALQNTTYFSYNLGNLIGITDALQNTKGTLFYDSVGRVVTATDALGRTSKYEYNNLNQFTKVTDPLGGVTSMTYDGNGNLVTVQDARQQGTNNRTVYTINNMDRIQTRTDQLLRQESFTYDLNGNLQTATDRRSKVTTYQYDALNRRSFVGYGTTLGPVYESTTTYSYDGGNRLSSAVDSVSGTITRGFDGLNRLTSETTPQGGITYTFDTAGRPATSQVAGQPQIVYTFDNANRLHLITQGSAITTIGYDSANRRNSITLPSGLAAAYGYDNDSHVTSVTYQFGASSIGNLTYNYDPAGQRVQMGGSLASTAFPQAVASAVYDVANELTNWNGATISYDANGSVQNDGVAVYNWNARNQLASRGSASFQYDAYGRRIQNTAGSNLLYNGTDVVQEVLGGTVMANRTVGAIDEFFARTDSSGSYGPITDALGSVLALADSSGNLTTQYNYDPFGSTSTFGAASANTSQYTGRENDANGLYYYRARYYNPAQGRFISEDPIGFSGGINVYRYAYDNPLSFRDPSGLAGWENFYNNPLVDFVSDNSDYLPGICSGGVFLYGLGGPQVGNGYQGTYAFQDWSVDFTDLFHPTVHSNPTAALVEVGRDLPGGEAGVGAVIGRKGLQEYFGFAGLGLARHFAAGPLVGASTANGPNPLYNDHYIGLFAEGNGHWLPGTGSGAQVAGGGGIYLTVTSASQCVR